MNTHNAGSPPAVPDAADRQLVDGVLARQRRALAKTITLIESTRPDHQKRAQLVLDSLLPHTGKAIRIGISGVPGAGKSTFIEALGTWLIDRGHRLAVLAVDPSSSVSGGSILGDKTRMELLCQREEAFIRPSPSAGSLGGVAEKTREAMLVCEAAGYDVVIIETVGVGQSETAVAGMVDMFCLLQLPNAGDDLQAIKKGIVEIADMVVINKADIDPRAAQVVRAQWKNALHMLRPASPNWAPPVITHTRSASFMIYLPVADGAPCLAQRLRHLLGAGTARTEVRSRTGGRHRSPVVSCGICYSVSAASTGPERRGGSRGV